MIALRVSINSEAPITAGADDLAVLGASVSSLHAPSSSSQSKSEKRLFDCHLSGLRSLPGGIDNEHLSWLKRWDLKVGDKVTIEIVEVEDASPVLGSKVRRAKTNGPSDG